MLTVAAQVGGVVGAVLGVSALRDSVTLEMRPFGAGTEAAIAGIDLVYVAPRRVSPAYPLDAWADLGLLGAWMWAVNDTTLMIVLRVVIDCRVGR